MIKAVVFDVDGTLVQTERLKAQSYAIAVQRLLGQARPDRRVVEAYKDVVGAARNVASRYVMECLGLQSRLRPLMVQYNVSTPEEVLTAMRLEIYLDMVAKSEVLRDNQWPHTVDLLRIAKEAVCLTALATMSKRDDTMHVVNSLDIGHWLDLVLTAEDVEHPKPDPEIYLLAAEKLGVPPAECLALEDSVNGVQAALAAGTNVVAIATPFTGIGLHLSGVAEDVWVVHKPEEVAVVVRRYIEEHNRNNHPDRQPDEKEGA
jgi:beta-phosphoglucomutase